MLLRISPCFLFICKVSLVISFSCFCNSVSLSFRISSLVLERIRSSFIDWSSDPFFFNCSHCMNTIKIRNAMIICGVYFFNVLRVQVYGQVIPSSVSVVLLPNPNAVCSDKWSLHFVFARCPSPCSMSPEPFYILIL